MGSWAVFPTVLVESPTLPVELLMVSPAPGVASPTFLPALPTVLPRVSVNPPTVLPAVSPTPLRRSARRYTEQVSLQPAFMFLWLAYLNKGLNGHVCSQRGMGAHLLQVKDQRKGNISILPC